MLLKTGELYWCITFSAVTVIQYITANNPKENICCNVYLEILAHEIEERAGWGLGAPGPLALSPLFHESKCQDIYYSKYSPLDYLL